MFGFGVETKRVQIEPGCIFIPLLIGVGYAQIDPNSHIIRLQIQGLVVGLNGVLRVAQMSESGS